MARAQMEVLRSVASGGLSGSYVVLGTAFDNPCRLIVLTNNTDGDLLFSRDGVNDELFVAAGSFKLFDLQANCNHVIEEKFVFDQGTQFYVKEDTASSTGSVYLEVIY